MNKIIPAFQFMPKIIEAIGEETSHVRRIVIDMEVDNAIKIYVEKFGDDRMLQIEFPTPDGINIKKINVQNDEIEVKNVR